MPKRKRQVPKDMMVTIPMLRRLVLFVLLGAGALAGCDPQVSPGYRGAAIVTLQGTVVASPRAVDLGEDGLDVAVVWEKVTLSSVPVSAANAEGGPAATVTSPINQRVLTKTAVHGNFPASFKLQVFSLPPDEAFFSCYRSGDPRVGRMAWGFITALRAGTEVLVLPTDAVRGQVSGYVLAYLDHDLDADSECARLTKATSAGYHLLRRKEERADVLAALEAESKACTARALCLPAPEDPQQLVEKLIECSADLDAATIRVDAPNGFDTPLTLVLEDSASVVAAPQDPEPTPHDEPEPSEPSDINPPSACP